MNINYFVLLILSFSYRWAYMRGEEAGEIGAYLWSFLSYLRVGGLICGEIRFAILLNVIFNFDISLIVLVFPLLTLNK